MTTVVSQEYISNEGINNLINETESSTSLNIPENSETILENDTTSRFKGAEWFKTVQAMSITIAGLGGIGSWTAFLVSRLSPSRMKIYDPDTVEEVNLSGQLFSISDTGHFKAYAVNDFIHEYSNYFSVGCHSERFTLSTKVDPLFRIMICGFDNMAARKDAYTVWKRANKGTANSKNALFVDARLNAEEFQIFCIRGDGEYSMNLYEEKYLFDDSKVSDPICSYKQTTFCASMIASFICNLLVNHAANLNDENAGRDLPFFTYYNAAYMYLKTE